MLAQPFRLTVPLSGTVVDQDSPATTIAAGSNGVGLPFGTIHAASTAAFPASGTLYVVTGGVPRTVTYTGKVGGGDPQFTGCLLGSGMMATGGAITGWRVITFNPSGSVWYRIYLALVASAGATQAAAKEMLLHAQTVIRGASARWFVTIGVDGHVRVRYNGTGNGYLTLPAVISTLLGFNTGLLIVFVGSPGDDTAIASRQPTHCIFSSFRKSDNDWKPEHGFAAMSEMDTGDVDYMGGDWSKFKREFTLAAHPRTPSIATTRGETGITAMLPDDDNITLWRQPVLAPAGDAKAWSIHQFLQTSKGKRLGFTFGEFQDLVSGAATLFDEGSWTRKTLESPIMMHVSGWNELTDRTMLEVTKRDRVSRV